MKNIIFIIGIFSLLFFSGCNFRPDFVQDLPSGVHKVKLKEFLQTNNYTYLLVSENGKEQWLAVPLMEAKVGLTYYYKGGMEMNNFISKELDREFESVMFLGKVSRSPVHEETENMLTASHSASMKKDAKMKLNIDQPEGVLTIAELFANKEKYEGKTIKVKGQVTKFNAQIMDKNWIHIQDGTEYDGLFDLTVTSTANAKVGDIINLKGKIVLNKDFGYGYKYDIIMEEAVLSK